MVANLPYPVTASQDGIFGDREYVVACKGRPFTILAPTSLPTPPISYVDHKLVTELKLRMSDLQCSRLHYGSKKLRILGKISTSVQCIEEGRTSGNMHFKALVIENLSDHFDVHSIAGIKLNQILTYQSQEQSSSSSESSSENDEPTKTPRKKKKKIPNPSVTPLSTPSNSPSRNYKNPSMNQIHGSSPSSTMTNSPPGFPTPVYPPPHMYNLPVQPANQRSHFSVNISRLTEAFGGADLIDDLEDEQAVLAQADPSGTFDVGGSSFAFHKSGSPAYLYRSGHGRLWCRRTCRHQDDLPHNCGFHPQWQLPHGFENCGHLCKGGLCECLRGYDDYGYYG